MVFSLVSAMAEFERIVISERTNAGMAAAGRRGRMIVEGEGRAHKLDARKTRRKSQRTRRGIWVESFHKHGFQGYEA